MNLPFGLRRTIHFGGGKKMIGETRAIRAEADVKFATDTFEIPADFSVLEH